ncbi:MAG: hypothetical protein QMD20_01885 [Candidatus Bathyarchaeia archaeon]|nr:hypothetical protein [Candidatus Bathyarchaeia archaeon]
MPEKFLEWAYFDRVRFIKKVVEGKLTLMGPIFLLESARHNPIFCTASRDEKGHITVNGKVVGAGFVLKKDFLGEAVEKLRTHVEGYATMSGGEYMVKGINLMLELLYLEDKEEARKRVDFSKISTLEIAKGRPGVAKHTWANLQRYKGEACLIYYMPPTTSFEVRWRRCGDTYSMTVSTNQ